jgi:hypothetical protein
MITSSERVAEITIRKVIEELVRYNEDQKFSYDRDELIGMLDEEMQGTRVEASLRRFQPPPSESAP